MIKETQSKDAALPPKELILDLLNGKPRVEERVLEFYSGYISSAAKEPQYTDGILSGIYLNEDLKQEMEIELVNSFSVLQNTLREKGIKPKSIMVIIESEESSR